ncbi:MAG: FecR domain-containing protein [Planctomycetales bacterium]|nr:FecR domain-containing protein [Planctomycetales bacterium]
MTARSAIADMPRDRLIELIGALCNGVISDADGGRLDEVLRDSAAARTIYTNYMWMHGSLYGDAGELLQGAAGRQAADDDPEVDAPSTGRRVDARNTARGSQPAQDLPARRRGGQWLALAASLMGVAVLSSMLTRTWDATRQASVAARNSAAAGDATTPASPSVDNDQVVARITGTHNCVWADSAGAGGYGVALLAGQHLQLQEGLVEVTFNDGATLLLEGPASFTVSASDRVALNEGRLAAVVPGRARGFRVQTRALDVWEVAAEFGVVAQQSGAAELHVFNGSVSADVLDEDGHSLQRLELGGAQAARVNPLSTTVAEFPANDAMFVRNLLPSAGPHDGLLAYDGFRYPNGPLEAQNGGFGWAGAWFNIAADDQAGPESNEVRMGSLAIEGVVPVGNRAAQTAQHNRIRRSLATSVGGVFDTAGLVENQDGVRLVGRDGNEVYISFLQRVDRIDDGFYGVEFQRGDGNSNRVLCIGNGADGAGYGATSNVNVYGAANLPALGAESSEVNLFVIKITYGVANRDVVQVYRNPESLRDESLCHVDAVLRGNFAFDRISLGNFDGTKVHEVDELRVGTHFLAVTGRWGSNPGRLQRRIAFQPLQSPGTAIREGQVVWAVLLDGGAGNRAVGDRG